MFSPYALNRDPRVHSDPERFNPGRWAADDHAARREPVPAEFDIDGRPPGQYPYRAAMALSTSTVSAQANRSPMQFLMPCPNGKNDARRSGLVYWPERRNHGEHPRLGPATC